MKNLLKIFRWEEDVRINLFNVEGEVEVSDLFAAFKYENESVGNAFKVEVDLEIIDEVWRHFLPHEAKVLLEKIERLCQINEGRELFMAFETV